MYSKWYNSLDYNVFNKVQGMNNYVYLYHSLTQFLRHVFYSENEVLN